MNLCALFGFSIVVAFSIMCTSDFPVWSAAEQDSNIEQKPLCNRDSTRAKREASAGIKASPLVASQREEKSKEIPINETAIVKFKRLWPTEQWKRYGLFSEDYLDLINDHWLSFPPPSPTLQKTLGGLYFLFSTVGCGGNLIVLVMYFSGLTKIPQRNEETGYLIFMPEHIDAVNIDVWGQDLERMVVASHVLLLIMWIISLLAGFFSFTSGNAV